LLGKVWIVEVAMSASQGLLEELARARRLTDGLFAHVRPEAMFERPIAERHRMIFYLGHLEAFDWNQIGAAHLGLPPLDAALDTLFAFGIDPPPGELPSDAPHDWPTLQQTREYVARARTRLDGLVSRSEPEPLHIAIEHRLMHAETFTYILHNLAREHRFPAAAEAAVGAPPPEARFVHIPAGRAQLGRSRGSGFGWDNEFGEHAEDVSSFAISRHKVTNGEYLAFVSEGGPVPHYWVPSGREWCYRGVHSDRPLPMDWPVYASYEQADAYARWRGRRLPTEAQWQRAAFGSPDDGPRRYPWGDETPSPRHANVDFFRFDPVPVTATPAGDSAFGVSQLTGNGWEWTRTPFGPFPGFEPFPTYPGYSANFFDEAHYVLKGGSPVTDRALLRPTFRNWFRPHYPYAYATFRLVEE
jgi:formylglycine-generating enzyme required for sulfatase activity